MKCISCGRKIGLLRRLVRSRFCCSEHRKAHGIASARTLRDIEDLNGDDEWESNALWRSSRLTEDEKKPGRDEATVILGVLAGGFVVLALVGGTMGHGGGGGGGGGGVSIPAPAYTLSTPRPGFLSRLLGPIFQGRTTMALHTNFQHSLSDWVAAKDQRAWSFGDGYARPTGLRLWKESTALSDYEFEFVGQIQRRGMSWAFRAPDLHNYYASKLTIDGAGSQLNAGLVRFVVLGGRECERVELPIPITLSRGVDYHVHLTVRGTRFLTSVNGQLVSSWSDSRLNMGGVGFFSEDGDMAAVKWASLTERDSMLGRLASYFSLISFPVTPSPVP
jgi:hypothetical protein